MTQHKEVYCSVEDFFFGAVTVGERGQVVIPSEARHRFGIEPGDKLLVFAHPGGRGVMLIKLEAVQHFMKMLQDLLQSEANQ